LASSGMTIHTITASVGQAELDSAGLLLARMGIAPADLFAATKPVRWPRPSPSMSRSSRRRWAMPAAAPTAPIGAS